MSTVHCLETGELQDMERCRVCFYKRLPDDVSTVFCRKPIYDGRIAGMEAQLRNLRREYIDLERTVRIARACGKIEDMDAAQRKQKTLEIEAEQVKAAQEAATELMKQAKDICDPRITTAEEYLYDNKKPFRALLGAGKDMHAFSSYIRETNVLDCGAAKKAAEQFFV